MHPVKVLIFGSIATAEDFENDDLFVHYFFHLENGWTSSSSPLFGVTQCSRTKSKGRAEVAHFSHPFELELENTAGSSDQEGFAVIGRLFIEVLSLDCWSRLRAVGYAYCDLLAIPAEQADEQVLASHGIQRICQGAAERREPDHVQSQGGRDCPTSSGVDRTAGERVEHHGCAGVVPSGQKQDAGSTRQAHSPGPDLSASLLL
ncbi:tectonic-like complex member MKS1 isoform X3 [Rhipicephalus microplus]|uniref:tectonic-like complex member MKS1 isoform X3 n=1 Tax=Rhipicephalus microplus TaxID=6941 RepID=UPI003F6A9FC0